MTRLCFVQVKVSRPRPIFRQVYLPEGANSAVLWNFELQKAQVNPFEFCERLSQWVEHYFARKTTTLSNKLTYAFLFLSSARALRKLHERDIVHRDLKPPNILLQVPNPQLPVQTVPIGSITFKLGKDIKWPDYYAAADVMLLMTLFVASCVSNHCGLFVYVRTLRLFFFFFFMARWWK